MKAMLSVSGPSEQISHHLTAHCSVVEMNGKARDRDMNHMEGQEVTTNTNYTISKIPNLSSHLLSLHK